MRDLFNLEPLRTELCGVVGFVADGWRLARKLSQAARAALRAWGEVMDRDDD